MPGCGMHSRPKLAENARYNSVLKNKVNNNNNNNNNKIEHMNSLFPVNMQTLGGVRTYECGLGTMSWHYEMRHPKVVTTSL